GLIEAHNISRVPSPNCPMLSTNRWQQRIAFEPTTAAQPWRREPLLMPLFGRCPTPSASSQSGIGRTPKTNEIFPAQADLVFGSLVSGIIGGKSFRCVDGSKLTNTLGHKVRLAGKAVVAAPADQVGATLAAQLQQLITPPYRIEAAAI